MWILQSQTHRFSIPLKMKLTQKSFIVSSYSRVRLKFTSTSPKNDTENYASMLNRRGQQAKRSFLIQHPCSEDWVLQYCNKFGPIANSFHQKMEGRGLTLVEFANDSSAHRVFESSQHFNNDRNIPVASRHLYFRPDTLGGNMPRQKGKTNVIQELNRDDETINTDLMMAKSIGDQMHLLHKALSMSEMACRLRHLICCHLEEMLTPLLPQCSIQPFGSSVNGFGKHSCDLDMVLHLDQDLPEHRSMSGKGKSEPLFFLTKMKPEDDRQFSQNVLSVVDGLLHHFVPHCTFVRSILKARVPIIKFRHLGSQVDCDLCMSNSAGLYMSELLYDFGQLDSRVSPLVFVIRHWARINQITHRSPGPWISNFTLTLLVVFFLQKQPNPVLPSIQTMKDLAEPADTRSVNGLDFSFVSDLTYVPRSTNTTPLEELLLPFFDFYGRFDFATQAISLVQADVIEKPETASLYLENPIEMDLNVSKNVMETELLKFQTCCQHASELLQEQGERKKTWGILAILEEPESNNNFPIDMNLGNIFAEEVISDETAIDISGDTMASTTDSNSPTR